MRHLLRDARRALGNTITIGVSVKSIRDHSKMVFLNVYDRTGSIQCITLKKSDVFNVVKTLTPQSVVSLTGTVKERPEKNRLEGDNGDLEFTVDECEIINKAHELPFDIETDINIDTRFDYRPLTLRRDIDRALFSLEAKIVQELRWYFIKNEFVEFQAPSLVGGDAEGGAEVFCVDFFDKRVSLATSPQLYKQILVGVFERVFSVSNVFRAEKHSTSRHLNEYTSIDFEMGYIEDHTDVMDMLEGAMRSLSKALQENTQREIEILGAKPMQIPSKKFPAMKLIEAQAFLEKECGIACVGEPDLSPEHERALCEKILEKENSDFVFITHYPSSKRPMYAYDDPENPGFTKSFDLLFRGVEICSGGQRVHKYDDLVKKIKDKLPNVDPEKTFNFYLQAFKYGIPTHGGIGMGLERLTTKIAGIPNAKEAAIFPRDRNRIDKRLYE